MAQNTIPAPKPAPKGNPPAGFHIMTKPIGPICNLDCKYCFYLEKEQLYPETKDFRMSDEVLENYVRQYIEAQEVPEVTFAWQGGEPTLMGVDFFRRAFELQKKHANGKTIHNTLQTNGTRLDDDWCAFFAEAGFLIGLSVDGPRELHDAFRVDKQQEPTFDAVMRGLEFLKKHNVSFNTLTVVNSLNVRHPVKVYRFLKGLGSEYLQFIPLVERAPDAESESMKLDFAPPPTPGEKASPVTEASVPSRAWGEFLVEIFEDWILRDVGRIYVQLFDVALANWMGLDPGLCLFAEKCGRALAMEHNGDLYSCDHYVYPRFKLGNLMNRSLGDMVESETQRKFGADKADTLPAYCRKCEVRFACHGECPKHRFIETPDGESGLNYLCEGYKRFFNHVDPYMNVMAQFIQSGEPAAKVMELIAEHEQSDVWENVGRNDPCPCGSGRKYKKCCMERREGRG